MQDRLFIVGVPVDRLTLPQAVQRAAGFFNDGRQHLIVTPNPEMAVMASRDAHFASVLASADLALADGFGLTLGARLQGKRIPQTIHGTDFIFELARLARQQNVRLFFLGGEIEGVAERAAVRLRREFPSLEIIAENGGRIIRAKDGSWIQDPGLLDRINAAQPTVLMVALGHGKQEKWLDAHLAELPTVRIGIGIGGAFDYLSGTKKRPPKILRNLHLEWLWRLFTQPKRFFRIIDAVVVFPLLALKERLKKSKV